MQQRKTQRRKKYRWKTSYLIQLLDHLTHDVTVLFGLTHLCCDHAWKRQEGHIDPTLCVLHLCVFAHACGDRWPLHPEHWMKKLMRSRRDESLSVLYASIQSSMTACSDIKLKSISFYYFSKKQVCAAKGWSHLHGTSPHGDHLKESNSLHMLPFTLAATISSNTPASGFRNFNLDIPRGLLCSFPPPLGLLQMWQM